MSLTVTGDYMYSLFRVDMDTHKDALQDSFKSQCPVFFIYFIVFSAAESDREEEPVCSR